MADIATEAQNINSERPTPELAATLTPEGTVTREVYTEEYHKKNAEVDEKLQAYVDGLDNLEISASDDFNLSA